MMDIDISVLEEKLREWTDAKFNVEQTKENSEGVKTFMIASINLKEMEQTYYQQMMYNSPIDRKEMTYIQRTPPQFDIDKEKKLFTLTWRGVWRENKK